MATTQEPHHLRALARANEIRLGQAALKKEIWTGALPIAEALHDERAQRMPVGMFLTAQRRWGVQRTRRLCVRLMIPENKRLCELTVRQRGVLELALEGSYVESWMG